MTTGGWQLLFLFLGALVLLALGVGLSVLLQLWNERDDIPMEEKDKQLGYSACSRPGCLEEALFFLDGDKGWCSWSCYGQTSTRKKGD
jgi:hypothetical protein